MAFLMTFKNYLNILMVQLFLQFFFLFAPSASVLPIRFDLYLKDEELLFVILIFPIISSLLKFHKLPEVSE